MEIKIHDTYFTFKAMSFSNYLLLSHLRRNIYTVMAIITRKHDY